MDPSMLIGFLVTDPEDWRRWRLGVSEVPGKPIIHVHDKQNIHTSVVKEREGAIDEVETFDTEEDDEM